MDNNLLDLPAFFFFFFYFQKWCVRSLYEGFKQGFCKEDEFVLNNSFQQYFLKSSEKASEFLEQFFQGCIYSRTLKVE